jgi:hypothetical protein
MMEEIVYSCTFEPPHHLRLEGKTDTPRGTSLRLSDADDESKPSREVFVTRSELAMGYDPIYKACFLCVDRGRKEKAFAIPTSDLE